MLNSLNFGETPLMYALNVANTFNMHLTIIYELKYKCHATLF